MAKMVQCTFSPRVAALFTTIILFSNMGWASGQAPVPPHAPATLVVVRAETEQRASNFEVEAPTQEMANKLAAEAEQHRRSLAIKWLGRELPAWSKPCPIRYRLEGLGNSGGSTTFNFGNAGDPVLTSLAMELRGEFKNARAVVLPHEVMHSVLATYFGKQVPRWADEGIAMLTAPDEEQASHDRLVREYLNNGRGIRVKFLFTLTEYPKDIQVLYAQGHSLARYLSSAAPNGTKDLKTVPPIGKLFENGSSGHRRLLAFVHLGAEGNTTESWTSAANTVFGFKNLDDLEEAWLVWLRNN